MLNICVISGFNKDDIVNVSENCWVNDISSLL